MRKSKSRIKNSTKNKLKRRKRRKSRKRVYRVGTRKTCEKNCKSQFISHSQMRRACIASCATAESEGYFNTHKRSYLRIRELPYFEKQHHLLCGKHAVNNALGGPIFSQTALNNIAYTIATDMQSSPYDFFDPQTGYYDAEVLRIALKIGGAKNVTQLTQSNLTRSLNKYNAFLLYYGNHWYALRKENNQWYSLNSMEGVKKINPKQVYDVLSKTCNYTRRRRSKGGYYPIRTDCTAYGIKIEK